MWMTFVIIAGAVFFYASEKISLEATSLLVVVILLAVFSFYPLTDNIGQPILGADELLRGFANPALISILALLVMGQGLFRSGALEHLIELSTRNAGRNPYLAAVIALIAVIILSAFLNNTPVVLMFIPVIAAISSKGSLNNSTMMMSLSFLSILGGMLTLIGSSTNLLVANTASWLGIAPIGFFDQTVVGLFLMAIGAVYVLFVMPFILGEAKDDKKKSATPVSGRQYIVEVRLRPGDNLVGASSSSGFFPAIQGMTLQMVEGQSGVLLPPFDDYTLQVGDRLFLAATRKELSDTLSTSDHFLTGNIRSVQLRSSTQKSEDLVLAELVVAPGSRMTSRAIYQTGFSHETDCLIVGVQRRTRMLRHQLSDIRLEAGDVLLVLGAPESVQNLRGNRDALLMEWSAQELPNFANANKARLIFGLAILSAALGIVPVVTAAMGGALMMLLTGVLNIRQAGRGVDMRIYLLVGAALSMSEAMSATGGAGYLASGFLGLFDGYGVAIILSAFFLICAVITNVLSNNATAVLFTPIAINLASKLGVDPTPFIFAVIFAANCSFATPIAYQTNLLVMTPGNFTFTDYLKAGAPLAFIIWIGFSLIAPWYYGL